MAQSYADFIAACDLPVERVGRSTSRQQAELSLNRCHDGCKPSEPCRVVDDEGTVAGDIRRAAWDQFAGEQWQQAAYGE